MSEHHDTPGRDTGRITTRRALQATAVAVVLFAAGAVAYRLGVYDPIRPPTDRLPDRAEERAIADLGG